LRQEDDLFDVTLVCNDGKQLDAHKLILSACSPLLRQMLSKSKHPHPFVFMPGMKNKELEAVLNFLYNGEVSVDQEDIAGFLSISQLLQIKGLTNNQENESQEVKDISMRSDREGEHFGTKKQVKMEPSENQNNHCS
jgi:broad-like protein